jgi:hypothetical protein
MTSVASNAAGARRPASHMTRFAVLVPLTIDDCKMIRAFTAWNAERPTCSPKKKQIERGFGVHRFGTYMPMRPGKPLSPDGTGPRVFTRLVSMAVIQHSRNGHCWLTEEGKRIAALLDAS